MIEAFKPSLVATNNPFNSQYGAHTTQCLQEGNLLPLNLNFQVFETMLCCPLTTH
jgi:hypothetical protein